MSAEEIRDERKVPVLSSSRRAVRTEDEHQLIVERAKELSKVDKQLVPKLLRLHYDEKVPPLNRYRNSTDFSKDYDMEAFASSPVKPSDAAAGDSGTIRKTRNSSGETDNTDYSVDL